MKKLVKNKYFNICSLFQVKMLAVMPTAGLLFGVISLAGAALCLVLFLYLRLNNWAIGKTALSEEIFTRIAFSDRRK